VLHYEKYQGGPSEAGTESGTAGAQQGHSAGTAGARSEEGEERKKGKKETPGPRKAAPEPNPHTGEAIAYWCDAWEKAGRGKHRSLTDVEGKTVKRLAGSLGLDGFKARVDRAFQTDWFLETGDLMVFAKHSEKFAPPGRLIPLPQRELLS
jgi:hypothetical protein